jgi:hypothetical protein
MSSALLKRMRRHSFSSLMPAWLMMLIIAVIEGADAFELLFGLVGERIAQIGHYHAAAVA